MFRTLLVTLCFSALVAPAAHANRSLNSVRPSIRGIQPSLVFLTPASVFVPSGFDDNDNVQIMLDGELPNTCYKMGPTSFEVDQQDKVIRIRQQAYLYESSWCAPIHTHYLQTLDVGLLDAGSYKVEVLSSPTTVAKTTTLPVAAAPSTESDSFHYAPVMDTAIERSNEPDTKAFLVLSGVFNSSCMTYQESRVIVTEQNVIEVLPIINIAREDTANCDNVATEFNVRVALPITLSGHYLIHIRSLNGQSFNRVIDL